jgi:hypothetical protein
VEEDDMKSEDKVVRMIDGGGGVGRKIFSKSKCQTKCIVNMADGMSKTKILSFFSNFMQLQSEIIFVPSYRRVIQ